jgi:hypothetical protein
MRWRGWLNWIGDPIDAALPASCSRPASRTADNTSGEKIMPNRPKFQIYYLASSGDPQLPRWIDYQRCGEHRW